MASKSAEVKARVPGELSQHIRQEAANRGVPEAQVIRELLVRGLAAKESEEVKDLVAASGSSMVGVVAAVVAFL